MNRARPSRRRRRGSEGGDRALFPERDGANGPTSNILVVSVSPPGRRPGMPVVPQPEERFFFLRSTTDSDRVVEPRPPGPSESDEVPRGERGGPECLFRLVGGSSQSGIPAGTSSTQRGTASSLPSGPPAPPFVEQLRRAACNRFGRALRDVDRLPLPGPRRVVDRQLAGARGKHARSLESNGSPCPRCASCDRTTAVHAAPRRSSGRREKRRRDHPRTNVSCVTGGPSPTSSARHHARAAR